MPNFHQHYNNISKKEKQVVSVNVNSKIAFKNFKYFQINITVSMAIYMVSMKNNRTTICMVKSTASGVSEGGIKIVLDK